MKHTFEIPEGCTRVTIEQHEDKLVTIFESKRFEKKDLLRYETVVTNNSHGVCVEFKEEVPEVKFKDGDILTCRFRIFIFSGKYGNNTQNGIYKLFDDGEYSEFLFNGLWFHETDEATYANESEKQQLFDALAKVGKKWNAEKKCVEELKHEKWRAEYGEKYWYVDEYFLQYEDTDYDYNIDRQRNKAGNYFKTEQQAKDFAEKIKKLPR